MASTPSNRLCRESVRIPHTLSNIRQGTIVSKQELLRILIVLSKLEGFVLGKLGTYLPEDIALDVEEICELLATKIKEPS